jgi:flagellar hook-length control protein FliK
LTQISTPAHIAQADSFLPESLSAENFSGGSRYRAAIERGRNNFGIFARLLEDIAGRSGTSANEQLQSDSQTQALSGGDAETTAYSGANVSEAALASEHSDERYLSPLAAQEPVAYAADYVLYEQQNAESRLFTQREFFGAEAALSYAARSGEQELMEISDSAHLTLTGEHGQAYITETIANPSAQADTQASNAASAAAYSAAAYLAENTQDRVEAHNAHNTQNALASQAAALADSEKPPKYSLEHPERESRERLSLEVRDYRTSETQAQSGETTNRGVERAFNPTHAEIEIPVDLKPSSKLADGLASKNSGHDSLQSKFFEDALARELRGNLGMDIVKNATIIIRNGGEGILRLALNPASLGMVKVHFEMTENKIMGRIIVESSEALRAFQKELPVLEKAFRDSGFLETSLDMSLAHDTQGGDEGDKAGQRNDGMSAADRTLASSSYESGAELSESEGLDLQAMVLAASAGRKTVNIFI